MTKFLKSRSKKLGAPPGSLIYTGDSQDKSTKITLIQYNETQVVEKQSQQIDELLRELKEGQKCWLHINGLTDVRLIDTIGRHFKLHPLLLEDVMNPVQRSKLDDYKSNIYLVTHFFHYDTPKGCIDDEQFSIVIGANFLITFAENETPILNPIRERLQKPSSNMRLKGPDYLAYTILDCIVDNDFLILETFDQKVQTIEDALFSHATPALLRKIQASKRELALLRKTIWPMREMINHLRRIDSPLVTDSTRIYMDDLYDHVIQAIDTIDSFREVTSEMLDIYISTQNQRMNEVMKVLTVVATIFVPLTFITSLYGMNFEHMPELHSPLGYPLLLAFMATITLGMLWFFRRKKWI